MTTIIVSIIGLLAIVAAFVFRMSGKISRKAFIAIGAVGLVTIVAGNSFVVIPTGYSGVRSTLGKSMKSPSRTDLTGRSRLCSPSKR